MLNPELRVEQVAPSYEKVLPPGAVAPVHTLPYYIGRGPANQLRIEHPDISRRHVCLRLADDYYWVEDLESRNGTLLNGTRLAAGKPHRLQNGDSIQLAAAVRLIFIDPAATVDRPDVRPLRIHGLWLDTAAQIVLLGDERLMLPDQQFRLLALLYSRAGAIVTRSEIADALWSVGAELTEQMIDNTVSRLRASLAPHAGGHEYIVTLRGRGYQFVQLP